MPLDTLANVKQSLGITGSDDDDLLEQLQAAADDFVSRHCGRSFLGGSFTEFHPGGGRLIFLREFPVSEVTSVRVDPKREFGTDTILDSDRFYLHPDRGVIESLGGPFLWSSSPGTVRVEYATATGQVPASVQRAYAELVGHWYRQAKTHASLGHLDLLSEVESGLQTNYPAGLAEGFPIPPGVLQVLKQYRDPAA